VVTARGGVLLLGNAAESCCRDEEEEGEGHGSARSHHLRRQWQGRLLGVFSWLVHSFITLCVRGFVFPFWLIASHPTARLARLRFHFDEGDRLV
jgi:hypothetical protein